VRTRVGSAPSADRWRAAVTPVVTSVGATTGRNRRPASRRHGRRLLLLALAVTLLPPALILAVHLATANRRYDDPSRIPAERVAIVFGAGVRPNGQPSPMLADRVRAAVELYRAGRVQKLLMTGDNARPEYDEVGAMRRYAIEQGAPAEAIVLDHAGFSTYESCYRAGAIFGVRQAVLVTQRYHLPRAVYTCGQLGVDAVGLGTPDWGVYSEPLMASYALREALATLNALWEVHVTHPTPTYLGAFEGIA
jgi:vancomycin permeability regulator SanA